MTKQKQMTEQELDQVNGGVVLLVVLAALKPSTTRKGNSTHLSEICDAGTAFRQGPASSNPTPHPAPTFRNVRGVLNPDSM